jgi:F0F1-type ATP synthase assembly protein I
MKYYIALFTLLLTGTAMMCAQSTVKMSAVKGNNYGVAYSLPKTSLVITVYYTKTTRKAGELYQYAER